MTNRRFEMYEYRQVIVRMRLGESDRAIAQTGLMGRKKVKSVRDMASSRGWFKPMRSPHDEDFHNLIDERYENAATIITSNLDFGEWGDAFPNKLLGAATLDRLRHGAYRLVLDGESYRTPRILAEEEK